MAGEFIFELIGADAPTIAACRQALVGFGTVRVSGPEETQLGRAPDGTIVCIRIPIADGIACFAQSRAFRPNVPVLLIGEGVDIDIATELIQCGAAEFITAGSLGQMLRPKLERALSLRRGSVLDRPELEAVAEPPAPPLQANRRRCFRAMAPGAVLKARVRAGEVALVVEDISIPTDGWPGGVGAVVDDAGLRRLPISEWSGAAAIPLTFHAPGEPPVAISARLVSSRRRRAGLMTHLAFQYLHSGPGSEAILRRVWLAGQRKALA